MTTCVLTHTHPEPADIGLICAQHFANLRGRLTALPAITHWLHVNIAAGGVPGERVSGSREDPIPLRVDVLDLIGPDSTSYVTPPAPSTTTRTTREFLLWEDGLVIGEYDTWRAAQTAFAAVMVDAAVDVLVIDTLTVRHTADELRDRHEQHPQLAERLEVARVRWQVRPTTRAGGDQAGVDAIRALLRYWAGRVADEGGFPWTGWAARNEVAGLGGWLTARLSWVSEQPWVEELVADLTVAHATAHRLVPWRAETRRDPDPCPRCQARAVVLHIAAGESRCERKAGGCGRRQPLSEYVLNAVLPESRRSA